MTTFRNDADERGIPFVEIDLAVVSYVGETGHSCVAEMFSRMTKSDGNVVALFPFQRLSHSFGIGGMFGSFDPEKEKKSNDNLRTWIKNFKERILENVDRDKTVAVSKANHYLAALEEQLKICDKTDEAIDSLSRPFQNVHSV